MKPSVAFVANYNKTLFFQKVATQLEQDGVRVFWICVSNYWYKRLLQDGVIAEQVLYLPRSIVKAPDSYHADGVEHNYQLNELIYSDRTLRHEVDFGEAYLRAIQAPIRTFIQQNQLSYIFGEVTWAHEILLNRMCLQEKALNCCFLKPHTIRIPNKRFAFFADELEERLYEIEGGEEQDWQFELKKPDYFHLNDKKNALSVRLLSLFNKISLAFSAEKHDYQDPTQRLNRLSFFSDKLRQEFNYYVYKLFVKTCSVESLPARFWVYYLHKQPEASIDIVGRYAEDQYANIIRLSKMMPDDCQLLVKEHSNAIGDRPYSFYKRIKQLNRVDLIDERADSYQLIEQAEKTVTVSGTVAYEAGLLNKPTLAFSRAFFTVLPSIETIEQVEKISLQTFKKRLYKNSFEGIISDPITGDPNCITAENIELVSKAFLQVIRGN